MELLGVLAFVLLLSYSGIPGKITKLENRTLKLEKQIVTKEVNTMSEIIKGLIGENCILKNSIGLDIYKGKVIEVDEEWIKLSVNDKQKQSIIVMRIENISEIKSIDK